MNGQAIGAQALACAGLRQLATEQIGPHPMAVAAARTEPPAHDLPAIVARRDAELLATKP